MKTLAEIIKTEPVYMGEWNNRNQIISDFSWKRFNEITPEVLEAYKGVNILFASYAFQYYEGSAFVLFEKGGELFEVNGSHCSCYGLEDQWVPDRVNLEELEHRLTKGTFGKSDGFDKELKKFLGV